MSVGSFNDVLSKIVYSDEDFKHIVDFDKICDELLEYLKQFKIRDAYNYITDDDLKNKPIYMPYFRTGNVSAFYMDMCMYVSKKYNISFNYYDVYSHTRYHGEYSIHYLAKIIYELINDK